MLEFQKTDSGSFLLQSNQMFFWWELCKLLPEHFEQFESRKLQPLWASCYHFCVVFKNRLKSSLWFMMANIHYKSTIMLEKREKIIALWTSQWSGQFKTGKEVSNTDNRKLNFHYNGSDSFMVVNFLIVSFCSYVLWSFCNSWFPLDVCQLWISQNLHSWQTRKEHYDFNTDKVCNFLRIQVLVDTCAIRHLNYRNTLDSTLYPSDGMQSHETSCPALLIANLLRSYELNAQ